MAERTVSRFTFGLAVFARIVVATAVEIALARTFTRWLGWQSTAVPGIIRELGWPNVVFARLEAERLFKACGLSCSGFMVEGRRPAPVRSIVTDLGTVDDLYRFNDIRNKITRK